MCDEGNVIDCKCGSVEVVMVRMGGLVSWFILWWDCWIGILVYEWFIVRFYGFLECGLFIFYIFCVSDFFFCVVFL